MSRESARNAVRGPYRACPAHPLAPARARQPRRSRTLLEPWRGTRCGRRGRGERTTRPVILAKRKWPDATSARAGLTNTLRLGPARLWKILTYERGNERAEHEPLAQRLAIQIVLADPDSSWPRWTHEHTKGLLRQDLPKGTDVSGSTQHELNAIAPRLNTRPRTCLDVATPLNVYAQLRPHAPIARGT
ncbi:MAG: IS30 family transposase [Nitrospirota bacterium]